RRRGARVASQHGCAVRLHRVGTKWHSYLHACLRQGTTHTRDHRHNLHALCRRVKELFGLDRCSFLCGDALEFLAAGDEKFDLCIASGILYHMVEPVRLIELISSRARRLIMWTHFYDDDALANRRLAKRLGAAQASEHAGFAHRVHRHRYGSDTRLGGFCGGTQPYSHWLPREELLRALAHFGWGDVEIAFEEKSHPNGPALALVATRR
ncbi:MAG: hypothetical protein QOE18_1254, partial [Chloroflexota bacterium]|nr:hypothetical protein [Chloroflexota bacterium]